MSEAVGSCGTVASVDGDRVEVMIGVVSACNHCQAKVACGVVRAANRTVHARAAVPLAPGDAVRLELSAASARLALAVAFVAPLVVALAAMARLLWSGAGDAVAGVGALLSVAAYFGLVRVLRGTLTRSLRIDAVPEPV